MGGGFVLSGERLVAQLVAPPHAEKGREVMESGPSLFCFGLFGKREIGLCLMMKFFPSPD